MTAPVWIALLCVVAGGMALATQAPINAVLARGVGDGVTAAVISFAVGLLVLLGLVLLRGGLPSLAAAKAVPWWAWTGGALGAFYVWAVIWSVPKLGVLTTFAALILGQLVMALVLDALGAFGLEVKTVSWERIGAVVLVSGGLVLSRL